MTEGRVGMSPGDGDVEVGEGTVGDSAFLRTLGTAGSKLDGWRMRLS